MAKAAALYDGKPDAPRANASGIVDGSAPADVVAAANIAADKDLQRQKAALDAAKDRRAHEGVWEAAKTRHCTQHATRYRPRGNATAESVMAKFYPATNWTQAWAAVKHCNPGLSRMATARAPLPASQIMLPTFAAILDEPLATEVYGAAEPSGLCGCGAAIAVGRETNLLDVASKNYPGTLAVQVAGMLAACNRDAALNAKGWYKRGQKLRGVCIDKLDPLLDTPEGSVDATNSESAVLR